MLPCKNLCHPHRNHSEPVFLELVMSKKPLTYKLHIPIVIFDWGQVHSTQYLREHNCSLLHYCNMQVVPVGQPRAIRNLCRPDSACHYMSDQKQDTLITNWRESCSRTTHTPPVAISSAAGEIKSLVFKWYKVGDLGNGFRFRDSMAGPPIFLIFTGWLELENFSRFRFAALCPLSYQS